MKLSKSKPNLKHKKILSLNINSLKNSCIPSGEEENIKKNNNKKNEEIQNFTNNKNVINNNDSESNSSQLDWVKRAIEVKTKNNRIIKLSLDNDNFFEQSKIKVNKLEKYKELENENNENNHTLELVYNNNFEKKNIDNIDDINIKKNSNNKNENKENGYMMVSTKASERFENNFKYLSNRKDKKAELFFPENLKKNDDNNIDEDMVNMNTITILAKTNNNISNNHIYKKRIKTGFLNYKNNSKKPIKPQLLSETRNNNYLSKQIQFNTNEGKDFTNIGNKKDTKIESFFLEDINKNNISLKNNHEFDINNFFLYNNNLTNTMTNYITPYTSTNKNKNIKLNSKDSEIKEIAEFSNYINSEKPKAIENIKTKSININNTKFKTYKFITPNKLNNCQKFSPSSRFIKTKISQKYLLSSYNKSNLLLRNFLTQLNLQKYYTILKLNGFDNISLLIEQMKTNMPIRDSELKKSGIKIPGDRAKILIRLEEKGNIFPFEIPKNVYYFLENNLNDNTINSDHNICQLNKWLKEFKMEKYLKNFINNGYYSVELFLFQMISKNPINDDILENDIGIDKIGHRSRILSILKEESKKMKEKLEQKEINFTDETKDCGCFTY